MRQPYQLSPVDAVVIFQPGHAWPGAPWWWRIIKRWFKPGYGHVLVLYYDPDGDAWLVLNPVYGGIQARAIAGSRTLTGHVLKDYPGTTWRMVRRDRAICPPLVRGPLTCVSVVKAVLGMGGRAWTPWQLCRAIDRHAAAQATQDPAHAGPAIAPR